MNELAREAVVLDRYAVHAVAERSREDLARDGRQNQAVLNVGLEQNLNFLKRREDGVLSGKDRSGVDRSGLNGAAVYLDVLGKTEGQLAGRRVDDFIGIGFRAEARVFQEHAGAEVVYESVDCVRVGRFENGCTVLHLCRGGVHSVVLFPVHVVDFERIERDPSNRRVVGSGRERMLDQRDAMLRIVNVEQVLVVEHNVKSIIHE